ncbi:recombination-associated protein RdgC [Cellvibrio mixtus]|uniref:recombination-associated protein RdgC n=1 Tax=Cellvibrio mixtus TaxID=39650 RepID=UPI000587205F|nr:recombination-associated protein RdgC [Cellvibrio mixtus]
MWFKNLRLYRLTEEWTISTEELNEKLAEFCFNPCGNLDPLRYGFEFPLGRHGSEFVHVTNGYIMICAKKQEKILPGGVIKEALEEKVQAISEAESRSVSRKERDALKDEIIFSLLPKAFTRSTLDYAYIAPQEKLIVVNSSSAKRAEDLLSKLREALGSLRCLPIAPKNIPTQVMTHWLRESQAPHQFELGEEVELQAAKDGRVVRCKKLDLTAAEIRNHLESGMHVTKIALIWKESISCIIDDQLGIKRLKFEDVISDKANERNPESKAEQFDADFAIMAMELKNFIEALLAAFGGESEPAI